MPYLPKPARKSQLGQKRKSSNRREDKRFYDSKAWKLTRQNQLYSTPYCEACHAAGTLTDCTTGGHIDHIVRRKDGGSPHDTSNLQTLCRLHHDSKSRLEGHYGCLVAFVGEPGEYVPAPGEKEELIIKLIG